MVLRTSGVKFVDFLSGCLHWDAHERFTPEDALQHDWIQEGYAKHTASREGREHGTNVNANTSPPLASKKRYPAQKPATRDGNQPPGSAYSFPPIEPITCGPITKGHRNRKAVAGESSVVATLSGGGLSSLGPSTSESMAAHKGQSQAQHEQLGTGL